MTSGWQGESKRHSIAKKYGKAGSKKAKLSKMSSFSNYSSVKLIVSGAIRESESITQEILRLNDKRLEAIERANDALRHSDIEENKATEAGIELFEAQERQEDDIREFVLEEDRQHDSDDDEKDEGYENSDDEG